MNNGQNDRNVGATGRSPLPDQPQRNRRSIRLRGYDYSQAGAYFVTICTQDRECLFGEIVDGEMRLNDAGQMMQLVWNEMPAFYPGVETDEFVVMPNHIHGIIVLVGAAPRGRPVSGQAQGPVSGQAQGPVSGQAQGPVSGQAQGPAPTMSLADVVHRFKTMTTKRYTDGVKRSGWSPFPGRLWQRNYYEHIIRNDDDLNRIREYIMNNPLQWTLDRENPNGQYPTGQPHDGQPHDGQPQDGQPQDGQPQGVAPTGMDEL